MEKGVPIRAISRGLLVLQAINGRDSITMMEAARAARVPYPTACRIMQTLIHEGFVEMEPNRKRYRATALVHTLSSGYRFDNRLVRISRPFLEKLTAELLWPVSIATRVGTRMVIRDSTHGLTSLTFTNYYPGDSLPLFSTASGKVHFAFCSGGEREAILGGLRAFGESDDKAMAFFSDTISQTRRVRSDGYATHVRNKYTETPGKTSSLSVPLFDEDRYVAALNLIYFSSAMPVEEAVRRYLTSLKATALEIGGALTRDRIAESESGTEAAASA